MIGARWGYRNRHTPHRRKRGVGKTFRAQSLSTLGSWRGSTFCWFAAIASRANKRLRGHPSPAPNAWVLEFAKDSDWLLTAAWPRNLICPKLHILSQSTLRRPRSAAVSERGIIGREYRFVIPGLGDGGCRTGPRFCEKTGETAGSPAAAVGIWKNAARHSGGIA